MYFQSLSCEPAQLADVGNGLALVQDLQVSRAVVAPALRLDEWVVKVRLGVVHMVEDGGALRLHNAIDCPVDHLLALEDELVLLHSEAYPAQLPGAVFMLGRKPA